MKDMRRFSFAVAVFLLSSLACFHSSRAPVVVSGNPTAGVMGIDLGTEFIKVGGVKHGNIDIVLNEQSHRKSHHWLGFRGDDRFFAEEAKNFAARFPNNMAGAFNRMVGVPLKDAAWLANENFWLYNLTETAAKNNNNNKISATFGPGGAKNANNTYTAEESLGMMFAHLRSMAEKDLEQTTREAVVVVPSFYTPRQVQAVIDAAAIGGVKILSMMQSNTATGLMYGIQRRGFDKDTYVVLYDMGSAKTEVSLIQYLAPPADADEKAKKGKKDKIKLAHRMGTMKMVHHEADTTLGGRSFDVCLARSIEEAFTTKTKQKGPMALAEADPSSVSIGTRKGLISLFRAANKAKEVLGSNKQATVTVEGIVPDRDFNTQVTRVDFETRCEPLFKRSANLLQALFDKTGIDKTDVEALELMGGSARIPKLIEDLGSVFGKPASRTINGDEAAALGATYYAAASTDSIRVKSFAVKDIFARNISFSVSAKNDGEEPSIKPLFISSPAPIRKSISISRDNDFTMTVFSTDNENQRHDDFFIHVTGVRSALASSGYYTSMTSTDLSHPNNSHSIKMELRASEANIVTVEKATMTIRYASNVTKKVKMTEEEIQAEVEAEKEATSPVTNEEEMEKKSEGEEKEPTATGGTNEEDSEDKSSTTSDGEPAEEQPSQEERSQEEEEASQEKEEENSSPDDTATPREEASKPSDEETQKESQGESEGSEKTDEGKKKKKVPLRYKTVTSIEMKKKLVSLKVKINYMGEAPPLSSDEIARSRKVLKRLEDADVEKRELAAARNDIEAYILFVKGEGFFENQEILDKISQDNQTEIRSLLEKIESWFEDAPDDTKKDAFLAKLSELRGAVKKVLPKELKKKANLSGSSSDDSPKKKSSSSSSKKKKTSSTGGSKKGASMKKDLKKDKKKDPSSSSKKSSKTSSSSKKKKASESDTTEEL